MFSVWLCLILVLPQGLVLVLGIRVNTKRGKIEDYPYLVSFHGYPAALVNMHYILASAQSTESINVYKTKFKVGGDHTKEHYSDPKYKNFVKTTKAFDVIPLHNTTWPYDFDAVLIAVMRPILPDSPYIQVVSLPKNNTSLPVGTKVLVVEWGARGYLLESTLEILDIAKCTVAYKIPKRFQENLICAGNAECTTNLDRLSTGSLLISNGELYGFMIAGSKCPTYQQPALFSNITPIANKIRNITEI